MADQTAGPVRALDAGAARLRQALARRKSIDARTVHAWGPRELASLSCTLAAMTARGAAVRLRLGRAAGLVLCGPRVRLFHPQHIRAGRDLYLEEGVEIVGLSRHGIVFGDRCTIGRFSCILPTNKLLAEPGEGLHMGSNSNLGPYGYIGCSGYVEIGDNVLMGPRVALIAENHAFDEASATIKSQGVRRAPIRIENGCWLGAGVIVLAGVTIGEGSVIAAGAVVTKDILPYSVAAGVPARIVGARGSAETAEEAAARAEAMGAAAETPEHAAAPGDSAGTAAVNDIAAGPTAGAPDDTATGADTSTDPAGA